MARLPPVERRSLMESGMRNPTTRADVAIVVGFFVALLVLIGVFVVPLVANLIHHIPELFAN